jgi:hypothetical protein
VVETERSGRRVGRAGGEKEIGTGVVVGVEKERGGNRGIGGKPKTPSAGAKRQSLQVADDCERRSWFFPESRARKKSGNPSSFTSATARC